MVIQVVFLTFIQDPPSLNGWILILYPQSSGKIFSCFTRIQRSKTGDWKGYQIVTLQNIVRIFLLKNKAAIMAALETAPPPHDIFLLKGCKLVLSVPV